MRCVLILLMTLGCWQGGSALWMLGKAELAQLLIEKAWLQGNQSSPWPGADTRAALRMRIAALDVDLFVLDGHHGQALAFGPGLLESSVSDMQVIAGHRDSHFQFLAQLQPGLQISLQAINGDQRDYRVVEAGVVDSRYQTLPEHSGELLLVTCYPFSGASAGGPLRWVVRAAPVSTSHSYNGERSNSTKL